jgi:hypothetical protein
LGAVDVTDDDEDDLLEPPFHSPEATLQAMRPPFVLGGEPCRLMLARVLSRVPHYEFIQLACCATFVMPGRGRADYLSADLLGGQGVVVLGDGLLDLPWDEQDAVILPQAARQPLPGPPARAGLTSGRPAGPAARRPCRSPTSVPHG